MVNLMIKNLRKKLLLLLFGILSSNSVFAQVPGYSKTSDYPKLGTDQVWKDPRGLVWGEAGSMGAINRRDADSYCKMIGARLPTAQEFNLYRQDMGASKNSLPDDNGIPGKVSGYYLKVLSFPQEYDWTSTPVGNLSNMYAVFSGWSGQFGYSCDSHACMAEVRCVMDTKTKAL